MTTFFHASKANAPLYIIPFAVGNLLGPWILGPLFDTVGRKIMISATYLLAGGTLLVTAWLFHSGSLSATTLTVCWSFTFFFASAGASAAYLTVSEIFPMETRAMAIALFYACGTGIAIAAPWTFGKLIETGDVGYVTIAFVIGGVIMAIGGIVEILLGVEAAGKSLEAVARPINAVRGAAAARQRRRRARGSSYRRRAGASSSRRPCRLRLTCEIHEHGCEERNEHRGERHEAAGEKECVHDHGPPSPGSAAAAMGRSAYCRHDWSITP